MQAGYRRSLPKQWCQTAAQGRAVSPSPAPNSRFSDSVLSFMSIRAREQCASQRKSQREQHDCKLAFGAVDKQDGEQTDFRGPRQLIIAYQSMQPGGRHDHRLQAKPAMRAEKGRFGRSYC